MPRRPSLARRLTTATRWPVGILLTSWNYMWRTTPLHRSEEIGGGAAGPPGRPGSGGRGRGRRPTSGGGAGSPRALPDDVERDEVQTPSDGAGPYFHRVYRTRIRDTEVTPEQLV